MDPDAPIPVRHPVRFAMRIPDGRGGPPTWSLYGRSTPIRLRRLSADALRPLPPVTVRDRVELPHVGPGGVWAPIRAADGSIMPAGGVAAWLANGTSHADLVGNLWEHFGRTPVMAPCSHPSVPMPYWGVDRGHHPDPHSHPHYLRHDDGPDAARILEAWMEENVRLWGDAVVVRWRAYLPWRPGVGIVAKEGGAIDDLPASPRNWPAMADLHRRLTGAVPVLDAPGWRELAEHCPPEPSRDAARAASTALPLLAGRVRSWIRRLRKGDRGDRRLDAFQAIRPVIAEASWRALTGTAGTGAHGVRDLATMNAVLAMESAMASEEPHHTGAAVLRAYLSCVADQAADPDVDAEDLAALAP